METKEMKAITPEAEAQTFDEVDISAEDMDALSTDDYSDDKSDADAESAPESQKKNAPKSGNTTDDPDKGSDDPDKEETPDDGQEEESGETESDDDETDEASPEYYDIDGDKVTFDDLKRGYMRNKDYTQKTQDIAEKRKTIEGMIRVRDFMKNNPGLKDAIRDEFIEVNGEDKAGEFDAWLDGDPGKSPYAEELDGARNELNQLKQQIEIQNEISSLKSSYKVKDSEIEDICQYAVEHQEKTGVLLSLEDAYKLLNYENLKEQASQKQKVAPPKTPRTLGRGAKKLKEKKSVPSSFEDVDFDMEDIFD